MTEIIKEFEQKIKRQVANEIIQLLIDNPDVPPIKLIVEWRDRD